MTNVTVMLRHVSQLVWLVMVRIFRMRCAGFKVKISGSTDEQDKNLTENYLSLRRIRVTEVSRNPRLRWLEGRWNSGLGCESKAASLQVRAEMRLWNCIGNIFLPLRYFGVEREFEEIEYELALGSL